MTTDYLSCTNMARIDVADLYHFGGSRYNLLSCFIIPLRQTPSDLVNIILLADDIN